MSEAKDRTTNGMFHVEQIEPGARFGLTLVMREQRSCKLLPVADGVMVIYPSAVL
jgi:hypothetical protein